MVKSILMCVTDATKYPNVFIIYSGYEFRDYRKNNHHDCNQVEYGYGYFIKNYNLPIVGLGSFKWKR